MSQASPPTPSSYEPSPVPPVADPTTEILRRLGQLVIGVIVMAGSQAALFPLGDYLWTVEWHVVEPAAASDADPTVEPEGGIEGEPASPEGSSAASPAVDRLDMSTWGAVDWPDPTMPTVWAIRTFLYMALGVVLWAGVFIAHRRSVVWWPAAAAVLVVLGAPLIALTWYVNEWDLYYSISEMVCFAACGSGILLLSRWVTVLGAGLLVGFLSGLTYVGVNMMLDQWYDHGYVMWLGPGGEAVAIVSSIVLAIAAMSLLTPRPVAPHEAD